MAVLEIPNQKIRITEADKIRQFLAERGIWFDQWKAKEILAEDADQDTVLRAYSHVLTPFMEKNGYHTADVINLHAGISGYEAIRQKFLQEHRHTEDEVRFFVDGKGYFWFNPDKEHDPIFNVLCEAGDLISVPANTRHWFDAGKEAPSVKAIRIFIDPSGWVPHYTGSGIDKNYNP